LSNNDDGLLDVADSGFHLPSQEPVPDWTPRAVVTTLYDLIPRGEKSA
jgi:hypothetical protein